jgi:Protein of unknown function (DUF3467)
LNGAEFGRWTIAVNLPQCGWNFAKGEIMADEAETETTPQSPSMQMMIDERDMKTHYSNAYRIHATSDEVVVDLGFNMPDPNPRQGGQPGLLLKITDRVILNYTNAKRLAMSLQQLIKRYEQQFGELPVQQSARPPSLK